MANATLEGISFDSLLPGVYETPAVRPSSLIGFSMKTAFDLSRGQTKGLYRATKSLGDTFELGVAAEHKEDLLEDVLPSRYVKSEAVAKLERILSQAYGSPVAVTKIRELPQTRKQVKEVYFAANNSISKVWVFKADPENTARELTTYYIVHELGVPTGKPLGYSPMKAGEAYPFDVAVLGGIVEDAGDPYDALIENMELQPRLVFQTAEAVVRVIKDYQQKLTRAKKEFERYGIELSNASPRKELRERFFAGLQMQESKELADACDRLYRKLGRKRVVSHGDLHTGNLVTLLNNEDSRKSTRLDSFGIIDWESIMLDHPCGDVVDFWVHHQRKAKQACGDYDYALGDLMWQDTSAKDLLIQSALWHLYEMFDPARKNTADIEAKAKYHYAMLLEELSNFSGYGCDSEAAIIRREVHNLLKDQPFLNN